MIQKPPPGPAQVLVSKAGYTVFEGGNSVFSAPVLVFIGAGHSSRANYDIFDHEDQLLGYCRQQPGLQLRTEKPCQIFDAYHASLFRVFPMYGVFRVSYEAHGVAFGQFSVSVMGGGEMTIGPENEPLGYITGFGLGGGPRTRQEVLDHERRPVAEVQTIEKRGWFTVKRRDVVINIDPMLTGTLRRLLIAIPAINDQIRRRKSSKGT